ncbi:MAG: hypothetical protein ACPG80_00225, partial [Rickettsiales bacterium]
QMNAKRTAKLVDALQKALADDEPQLGKLEFRGGRFEEGCLGQIVAQLAHFPQFHTLEVDGAYLDDAAVKPVADLLANSQTLVRLDLKNNQIGDEGAKALAEALKQNCSLKCLQLRANAIGEEGLLALAEALQENTTLEQMDVYISGRSVPLSAFRAFAKALPKHPNLALLKLCNSSREGCEIMAEAVKDAPRSNMVQLEPRHAQELNIWVENNEQYARKLRDAYHGLSGIEHCPPDKLLEFYRAIPALAASFSVPPSVAQELRQFVGALPKVDMDQPLSLDALVKEKPMGEGGVGWTPVDNPEVMERFGEIAQGFQRQGEPLRAEALLEDQEARKPQPSRLLKAIARAGKAYHLFTPENWKGASHKEMRRVYHAMPEAAQRSVSIAALALDMQRQDKRNAQAAITR